MRDHESPTIESGSGTPIRIGVFDQTDRFGPHTGASFEDPATGKEVNYKFRDREFLETDVAEIEGYAQRLAKKHHQEVIVGWPDDSGRPDSRFDAEGNRIE